MSVFCSVSVPLLLLLLLLLRLLLRLLSRLKLLSSSENRLKRSGTGDSLQV
jgi:hypothetical protein